MSKEPAVARTEDNDPTEAKHAEPQRLREKASHAGDEQALERQRSRAKSSPGNG
jgi:hypothetical protein